MFFQIFVSINSSHQDQSALQRMEKISESDYRWKLWSQAWGLIQKNPFAGAGIGSYAQIRTESQTWIPLENSNLTADMYHHSHMWILQLLIDHGIFIGGLLIFLVCFLMYRSFRIALQKDLDWILWLFAWVIFVHSFTEYPLWYISFFMLFFFCLSFLLPSKEIWNFSSRLRMPLQIIMAGALFFAGLTLYQYTHLIDAYYHQNLSGPPVPGQNNPLLAHFADFYEFSMLTELNEDQLGEKIKLCEK